MVCALTPIRSASSCEVIVCSGALLNWVTICKALLDIKPLLFPIIPAFIVVKHCPKCKPETGNAAPSFSAQSGISGFGI